MKVYVIVEHAGTPNEKIVATSAADNEFDAIAGFLRAKGRDITNREWNEMRDRGYSCEPAELTLLREVGK